MQRATIKPSIWQHLVGYVDPERVAYHAMHMANPGKQHTLAYIAGEIDMGLQGLRSARGPFFREVGDTRKARRAVN